MILRVCSVGQCGDFLDSKRSNARRCLAKLDYGHTAKMYQRNLLLTYVKQINMTHETKENGTNTLTVIKNKIKINT